MRINRFYVVTSIFILLVLGYLSYQILKPFFNAIAWAIVFTIVFYPVYAFILKYGRSRFFTSLITTALIFIVIVAPFIYLSFVFLEELKEVAGKIDKEAVNSVKNILNSPYVVRVTEKIQSYLGIEGVVISDVVFEGLKKFGKGLVDNLSVWAANISRAVIDFIFMGFAVFFLLRDGPDFLQKISNYIPFSENQKDRLKFQMKDMIVSTVYGGVVVAIIQGALGGIAFFALGLKTPVLWGTAMAVMSFLPMVGTFTIWGPAVIYLLIKGSYMKGIVLLLFGSLVISIVDNVLRPAIISGRTKMPTLLIFFSVIGGINFFGFIGFVIGPLILALFISVFEIFRGTEEGGANA